MTNVYQPSADGKKTIRELRARTASPRVNPLCETCKQTSPTFMFGSGRSGISALLCSQRSIPPMRKALIPMLAVSGAVRRRDHRHGDVQRPRPTRPAQADDGGRGGSPDLQLAANDAPPDGAPPPRLAPALAAGYRRPDETDVP